MVPFASKNHTGKKKISGIRRQAHELSTEKNPLAFSKRVTTRILICIMKTSQCKSCSTCIWNHCWNYVAEKSSRILCSDWLPQRPRWAWDFPRWSRKKHSLFDDIINSLLTKLVWARWLDTGLLFYLCVFNDFKLMRKKELGQYPAAIFTSRLVSNTYVCAKPHCVKCSIPDYQGVAEEELMQSLQLCMFLFHMIPLDQSCTHIPCLMTAKSNNSPLSVFQ